ncbi:unnamed protein product, partial [Symbiodinium sp. KB8]
MSLCRNDDSPFERLRRAEQELDGSLEAEQVDSGPAPHTPPTSGLTPVLTLPVLSGFLRVGELGRFVAASQAAQQQPGCGYVSDTAEDTCQSSQDCAAASLASPASTRCVELQARLPLEFQTGAADLVSCQFSDSKSFSSRARELGLSDNDADSEAPGDEVPLVELSDGEALGLEAWLPLKFHDGALQAPGDEVPLVELLDDDADSEAFSQATRLEAWLPFKFHDGALQDPGDAVPLDELPLDERGRVLLPYLDKVYAIDPHRFDDVETDHGLLRDLYQIRSEAGLAAEQEEVLHMSWHGGSYEFRGFAREAMCLAVAKYLWLTRGVHGLAGMPRHVYWEPKRRRFRAQLQETKETQRKGCNQQSRQHGGKKKLDRGKFSKTFPVRSLSADDLRRGMTSAMEWLQEHGGGGQPALAAASGYKYVKRKPSDTNQSRPYQVQMRTGKRGNDVVDGGHFESLEKASRKASEMKLIYKKKERRVLQLDPRKLPQLQAGSSDALNATPALVAETQADAPAAVATPEGSSDCLDAQKPLTAQAGASHSAPSGPAAGPDEAAAPPGSSDALGADIFQWAARVMTPHVWLEALDVYLDASLKGMRLLVLVYKQGDLVLQPAEEFFAKLCPDAVGRTCGAVTPSRTRPIGFRAAAAAAAAAELDSQEAQCVEESLRCQAVGRDIRSDDIQKATKVVCRLEEKEKRPLPLLGSQCTLQQALGSHATLEAAKQDLWWLLAYLRMGKQGMDQLIIADHFAARRAGMCKDLRWHDKLRRDLKVSEIQQAHAGQRTSRAQAWREVQDKIRGGVSLPDSMQLQSGDVVLVQVADKWCPAIVLALWRLCKKGSGAMLTYDAQPRGVLHSLRVALCDQADGGALDVSSDSSCQVVKLESVGPVLAVKECVSGSNGFRCKLRSSSLEVLSNLGPVPEPKTKVSKGGKHIEPAPSKFKRTKDGKKLVIQEMRRMLYEDADKNSKCPLLDKALAEVSLGPPYHRQALEPLLESGMDFFSAYFWSIRSRVEFSLKEPVNMLRRGFLAEKVVACAPGDDLLSDGSEKVFAVLFTQAVYDYNSDNNITAIAELDEDVKFYQSASTRYWGSLAKSMLSLFMSIAGGVSWEEAVTPLDRISTIWTFCFLFYIAFTYFAVLNVVTGVFCQSAIESAQNDHAMVVQSMIDNKTAHLTKIKALFSEIGAEESGVLTIGVFEEKIKTPAVRQYFEALGLDVWDAWSFFKLLDVDGGGAVEIEEFFLGCLKFRGAARSMDVGKILQDQKWMINNQ